ncbi:MAG: type II toxin-antitoxin system RelE/ParE family toxin [Nitrospirota bacterium]|nr:type II toxin-antitoxin system RelE/ParE family toxin [Nitrospirota bacterium]
MAYQVNITRRAADDLQKLHTYIAERDSPERAGYVLDQISSIVERLSELPERGTVPRELAALGIHEFREVFFKPYRVIYYVEGNAVFIVLIADGRRDMQSLLQRRLLG